MEYSFTKRLRRKDGELLSGYLMRAVKENHIEDFSKFINEVRKTPRNLREVCRMHFIDSATQGHMDIDVLSGLSGLPTDVIFSMTTGPLCEKFTTNQKVLNDPKLNLLNSMLEKSHRRFCPHCLKDNGAYKLIWQLKSIKVCNTHGNPLTTECPKCGAKQPYTTKYLGALKCYECRQLLYDDSGAWPVHEETECSKDQLYLYRQWEYLLDNKTKGLTPNPKMSYDVQMAYTLLFLLYKGSMTRYRFMSKSDRDKIFRFIKFRNKEVYVTPYKLIKYMEKIESPVSDFFDVSVPQDFIDSLTQYLDIDGGVLTEIEVKREKLNISLVNEEKSAEVLKIAKRFLMEREPTERLLVKEVYPYLPYKRCNLSTEVTTCIREMVDEYNKRYLDNMINRIKAESKALIKKGVKPTYKKVADRIGFHVMNIKRHPEWSDAIKMVIWEHEKRLSDKMQKKRPKYKAKCKNNNLNKAKVQSDVLENQP